MPAAVQTGLVAVRERAAGFDGPVVDLSVGAPVDPTPAIVQRALAASADAPGYPLTIGRAPLREAYVRWLARVHGVTGLDADAVLPVIGTKELIGSLPLHLGIGAGDLVVHPRVAYPTYAVGAALVGAQVIAADSLTAIGPQTPRLLWLNSPSNPTGQVLPVDHLRKVVDWCRHRGTLLVSDECYLDLGWDARPLSVLHPSVCGDTHDGVLALHSLSKRSNLAGYRCGFVAGDAAVVAELASVRRNLGLQMPSPQQGAAAAALDDDEHVAEQRARYARRRLVLRDALLAAGFRIDHSEAGLYLWATRDEPAASSVGWLADLGIVSLPGTEYGVAGARHVRLALTATDVDVSLAANRLHCAAPFRAAPFRGEPA